MLSKPASKTQNMHFQLLLIVPSHKRHITLLQLIFQILIYRKRHRLPRRHPHDSRCDTLVESFRTLLFEHLPRNFRYPANRGLPRLRRRPLQPRLNRINGRIAERAHRTTDQANNTRLPAGEIGAVVLRLRFLEELFEFSIRGEVDRLVGALAEGREGHTPVEGADPFFAEDGEHGVCGVAVFRDVEGVTERVVLGLQADFNDFHRCYDRDSFRYTGAQTS